MAGDKAEGFGRAVKVCLHDFWAGLLTSRSYTVSPWLQEHCPDCQACGPWAGQQGSGATPPFLSPTVPDPGSGVTETAAGNCTKEEDPGGETLLVGTMASSASSEAHTVFPFSPRALGVASQHWGEGCISVCWSPRESKVWGCGCGGTCVPGLPYSDTVRRAEATPRYLS